MQRKNIDSALKHKIRDCMLDIPITINTHFGDPFQPTQWENTVYKLKYLKNQKYRGEIEVSTKWILSDNQINELYSINPDMWIICGITGMDEVPSITRDARYDNYLRICKKFRKTILNVRPIIPGRNDSIDTLKPIIEIAAKGRKLLKHGGYLNPHIIGSSKTTYDDLKLEIHTLCLSMGVNDGPRCTSLVSDVTGRVDSTYSEDEPVNLDVLNALGFRYILEDGYIALTGFETSNEITKGDVSFARLIIRSSKIKSNWTIPVVNMQMKGPSKQMLFCTSSWFHWAREVPCMVNCDYCHVKPGTPIFIKSEDSGCSPLDLYCYLFGDN